MSLLGSNQLGVLKFLYQTEVSVLPAHMRAASAASQVASYYSQGFFVRKMPSQLACLFNRRKNLCIAADLRFVLLKSSCFFYLRLLLCCPDKLINPTYIATQLARQLAGNFVLMNQVQIKTLPKVYYDDAARLQGQLGQLNSNWPLIRLGIPSRENSMS